MGRVSKILNEQESNDFREGQRYHEVPAMAQAVAPRGSMDMSEVGHDDPDMEKQHPQKKADESVAHAIEADEERKESQPELIKPEHDTHDSQPEHKETTIKEHGMRKKVLCIVIPIITLLILGGVGAFLAYWFTRKPAEMTDGMTPQIMNIKQALGQALSAMDIGSQVPIEFAPVDLNDYSRQITLDLGSVVYLPDKPASYVADSYYQQFEYTLPVDFIEAGNPKLKSYTGWSDDVGVKAVQFTFSNGKTEVQTPVFGNTTPTYLTSKTVAMTDYVKTVDTKMLTTVTFGQTVFGIVNFKFNGQNSTQMGPEDPKGATATSPTRNTFSSGINANQKIVGVYGLKQTSSGSLRSFNFKVANEVHAVSQDEYYNQVETDFVRKTGQLNSDPSLMSALSLDDQLKVYGLTMQGYFGNNTTQQPSDLAGKLLWQAWSDKQGLDKHEAKVLFLQTVDGLW